MGGFHSPVHKPALFRKKSFFGRHRFFSNYLDRDSVSMLWKDRLSGFRDYAFELWSVLVLEEWGGGFEAGL